MTGSTVVTWASCAVAAGLAASAAASTNPIDERGKTVMSYSLKAASARDGIASPPPPATAIPALSDRRRTEAGDRGMTAASDLERGLPIRSTSPATAVLQATNLPRMQTTVEQ